MSDRLTREQLATFLDDRRKIRAFEQLFSDVTYAVDAADEVPPVGGDHHNATATDYIDFPDNTAPATVNRRLWWDQVNGTLELGLYGGTSVHLGQELGYYAKNVSGGTVSKGTPVMFAGTIGASGKIAFTKAVADGSVVADFMLGVALHDIANNGFGYVGHFGLVRGFDTTGTPYGEVWADGDVLYFGAAAAGTWTKTQPVAPKIAVPVAVVINAASAGSGSIFVRMRVSQRLTTLQDVVVSGVADYDLLLYNAAQARWENRPASSVQVVAWLGI